MDTSAIFSVPCGTNTVSSRWWPSKAYVIPLSWHLRVLRRSGSHYTVLAAYIKVCLKYFVLSRGRLASGKWPCQPCGSWLSDQRQAAPPLGFGLDCCGGRKGHKVSECSFLMSVTHLCSVGYLVGARCRGMAGNVQQVHGVYLGWQDPGNRCCRCCAT